MGGRVQGLAFRKRFFSVTFASFWCMRFALSDFPAIDGQPEPTMAFSHNREEHR